MLSKYFQIKTESDEFKQNLNVIFEELKGKDIVLYGAGEGFVNLDKKYDFKSKLNIVGISDLKFEKNSKNDFRGIKKIAPRNLPVEYYDTILVTNEASKKIVKYLKTKLKLDCEIKALFTEEIKDEQINLNYLYKHKFNKTLPKLIKDMKGKKVVIYGAGAMFKLIHKFFDLSELNIIAIADKRTDNHQEGETFLGYKVCSADEIEGLNPDYVIIATKLYVDTIRILRMESLKNVKVRPLIKKSFFALIEEAWN